MRRVPKYIPIKPGGMGRDPARSRDLSQCPTCALFTPSQERKQKKQQLPQSPVVAVQRRTKGAGGKAGTGKGPSADGAAAPNDPMHMDERDGDPGD